MTGQAGEISTARSGKDVASRGETGFASQAWILCKVSELSEDLWHPGREQGDSLAQDIRDEKLKSCSLSNVSTRKNAFNTAVVSH